MAIVVVGAGAIGLLVAGRLAQSSERTILLARPAAAAAMARQRPQLTQDGIVRVADRLMVIGDPAELEQRDRAPELAILCVKAYDTASALPTLAALQPRAILTLQNGIGNEEILAERFGAERIISGAITTSVEIDAPGCITVTRSGGIGLAAMDGRADIGGWLELLGEAGFWARGYDDYRALKWSKALLNMLGNATAAILDLPVAAVYADRRLVGLERRAFREALDVMDRLHIHPVNLPSYPAALLAAGMRWMPPALLDRLLRQKIAGGRGGKAPSLHLDLARGNSRSEGQFLYGAVARAAAQVGVDAPVNRLLWDTLRGIATGAIDWGDYRHNPERLLAALAANARPEQIKPI